NVSILVGDRLRGTLGAIVAVVGVCVPGALIMFGVGMAYGVSGDHPLATAALHGVAAAAVGVVTAVTVQVGEKTLKNVADAVFVALTVVGVSILHFRVPHVLLVVGTLAILWHRPRARPKEGDGK
ncbi:MAG: chromate transporter, partial [Tepidisphaeraceae bacterium]